jgi:hemolysin III
LHLKLVNREESAVTMDIYSRKQEIVNGLIHGIGVVFGVSGLPVLTGMATAHGNTPGIIGSGIYGFCFLLLFTCSMVYHLAQDPVMKRLFMIFDHISIYFLIAGTYTPFLLVYMNSPFGITLLSVLWALTILGIIFKSRFTGRFEIVSTIIYLLMGWIMIVGGRTFFDHLPLEVLVLLFAGAGLYSFGVIFYLWDKYLYTHAVWHSFVLAAAICHYVAVLLAM